MCGIVGGVFLTGEIEANTSKVLSALTHLSRRGPNDHGYESFSLGGNDVIIGHTRLSIIDLSSAGHQPMETEDRRFSMTFNGEIYNYLELKQELVSLGRTFHSQSDSEVLLNAWVVWGEGCLKKLDGMFAFSVIDKVENTLTCVRDAFGIKPLYYLQNPTGFYFGSEVPALLEFEENELKPNLQKAYDYLVFGHYDDNEQTFFANVNCLQPASILTVNLNKPREAPTIKQWWSATSIVHQSIEYDDAVKRVREEFLKSVKLQLRSDVPLGVALSGGLDSSALVCAIRHLEPTMNIDTFSYIAESSVLSEEKWVDKIQQHVGAVGHKVSLNFIGLEQDLPKIIKLQGEPFGSTSIYAGFKVFETVKNAGVTVVLEGQGADEILAGYQGYPVYRLRSLFSSFRIWSMLKFANNWRRWPGRNVKQLLLQFCQSFLGEQGNNFARRFTNKKPVPDWLNKSKLTNKIKFREQLPIRSNSKKRSQAVTHYLKDSISFRTLPALLRHGDRNSMNFSVESRVPFLSLPLVELVLSLPEHYLISDTGETKSIFRDAMKGIVPDDVLRRRDKVGYETPERDWFLSNPDLVWKLLEPLKDIDFIEMESIKSEVRLILSGDKKFDWQLWRWINFAQWHRAFISSRTPKC